MLQHEANDLARTEEMPAMTMAQMVNGESDTTPPICPKCGKPTDRCAWNRRCVCR